MNVTKIEWCARPNTTPCTWNPIHFKRDDGGSQKTGNMCTRISPGCKNCYASTLNERWGNRLEYIVENLGKGHFYVDEKELLAPLKTKKPCTVFAGDMFDLFHEAIPDEMLDRVFAVMAMSDRHTFQLLTKRAERMQQYISRDPEDRIDDWCHTDPTGPDETWHFPATWPMPNVWLGVSCESQKYADERIPLLLQTPAAVRFLSVEPQLEHVDLMRSTFPDEVDGPRGNCLAGMPMPGESWARISWVICGGESGPKARPFNLAWAESLREQCKAAGVAFFMKQVGGAPVRPVNSASIPIPMHHLKDRKGGDMGEWPIELRIREFPA